LPHALLHEYVHFLALFVALDIDLEVAEGRDKLLDIILLGVMLIGASYVAQGRLVHNSYLEALTELGPLGLALLLLVIAMTGWYLVRVFRRARAAGDDVSRIASATLLLALLGLAISMGFLSIALNKPLWIIVGLTLALERMSGERTADGTAGFFRRRRSREPEPGVEPA